VKLIDLSADQLSEALLELSKTEPVSILDSCGVANLGSHLMIAGIKPVETLEFSDADPHKTLEIFQSLASKGHAVIVTLSYDFGLKLQGISNKRAAGPAKTEPDITAAFFDALVIHDYRTGRTMLTGDSGRFDALERILLGTATPFPNAPGTFSRATSNLTRDGYLSLIEQVKENIRDGETYQVNLTQQITAKLPDGISPQLVFKRLRTDHPAAFGAFISRKGSVVVSASPERLIRVDGTDVSAAPIKGTRPRGETRMADIAFREELLSSVKDRAENTMIVDLIRNDLGRICEFGSIRVDGLCRIEEHPTLFHLVSTVAGTLKRNASLAAIIHAVFPCGSITGAPKIRTMEIIDRLEGALRGLSMGAIGLFVPGPGDTAGQPHLDFGMNSNGMVLEMSVAIRTMVIRGGRAVFNVGGGIVIDSEPESEFDESLLKAKALLKAVGAELR
jgi:para-aminobenzoate synthetase component 1